MNEMLMVLAAVLMQVVALLTVTTKRSTQMNASDHFLVPFYVFAAGFLTSIATTDKSLSANVINGLLITGLYQIIFYIGVYLWRESDGVSPVGVVTGLMIGLACGIFGLHWLSILLVIIYVTIFALRSMRSTPPQQNPQST